MKVEVVRSARRKKTVEARMVGDTLRIAIPAHFTAVEESAWVATMTERVQAKRRSDHIDLEARAGDLARTYDLPHPESMEWSDRQQRRWGSCTPGTRRIRISRRLVDVPPWVLDYVIVHELAHLVVPAHNAEFRALIQRYRLAERARGYLMAITDGWGEDNLDIDFPSDSLPA